MVAAQDSMWAVKLPDPGDMTVGRTRIVCNPMGYLQIPSERANGLCWDLVIDTEDLP